MTILYHISVHLSTLYDIFWNKKYPSVKKDILIIRLILFVAQISFELPLDFLFHFESTIGVAQYHELAALAVGAHFNGQRVAA